MGINPARNAQINTIHKELTTLYLSYLLDQNLGACVSQSVTNKDSWRLSNLLVKVACVQAQSPEQCLKSFSSHSLPLCFPSASLLFLMSFGE